MKYESIELAKAIKGAIDTIDESMEVKDFASAVANILNDDYSSDNRREFLRLIKVLLD
jgi:hypothetical protein